MAVGGKGAKSRPTAVDPVHFDDCPLLHPKGSERDLIFIRLSIDSVARDFVHRRCEQAAAFRREVKLVGDRLGEGQMTKVNARRGVKGDDRPPQRPKSQSREASGISSIFCSTL